MEKYVRVLILLIFLLVLSCREAPPEAVATAPRPIKALRVGEMSEARVLSFSGVVVAADVSNLSFAVAGRVASVEVNRGDSVQRGQILARLDPVPLELQVQSARARLEESRANARDAQRELDTTRTLYESDVRSRVEYDRAITQHASAGSRVVADEAAVGLAQINLDVSVIAAPFKGVIAERSVEPFTDVAPGQRVFRLQTENAVEIEVLIPARVVKAVARNQPVSIRSNLPGLREHVFAGRVTEVARTAEEANAFPVRVGLEGSAGELRPGMSAEATFRFKGEQVRGHFLLPVNALLAEPGSDQSKPWRERNLRVFVFDPATGTVQGRTIRVAAGLLGNKIAVTEGLSEGEFVATAGVHFLREGQQVTVLDERLP
jgi:RND family efflux transporter MFP subunit